ncbi:methyltransferase domain-containing protein [Thermococcus sp. M36]|uniref:class I SAM-dependent methyltransferase n=1 Tax=Thermococcus sp. M36 TaxID=1638261 RepID=UPI0014394E6D|nr:methyltransferase domain-containing protein [Thermococcus sp. M36]NJE04850.1 methyltransferase domain-containing protein [Thermococcus sp. M36]
MASLLKVLDRNIELMTELSVGYVFHLGLKHGLFGNLVAGKSCEEILASTPLPNKARLRELVKTYISLGIVKGAGCTFEQAGFSYEFRLTPEDAGLLLPDWVQILDEIYKMADYAFISQEHPKVLMDFDRGADFWDMRLMTEINRLSRRLAVELTGIEDGMRVLDLGCGSVSPVEIGEAVGPNGKYVGVDFSPGLMSIANTRVRNSRMDWVVLKEMDIRKILPRNTYDAVIMSFVLEYVENPEAVVRKALDLLDPGAKLVIIEPFRDMYPAAPALEFFESLTPEFAGFPATSQIISAVEGSPHDTKVETYGKSAVVVTKRA